jgi:hypothetical protein
VIQEINRTKIYIDAEELTASYQRIDLECNCGQAVSVAYGDRVRYFSKATKEVLDTACQVYEFHLSSADEIGADEYWRIAEKARKTYERMLAIGGS